MTYEELVARKNEICNSRLYGKERERALNKITAQAHRELAVGDGVTLRLWSDAQCTKPTLRRPIKRRHNTMTVAQNEQILVNLADLDACIKLMDEYGDTQFPFFGKNDDGEDTMISIAYESIVMTTFQKNDWARIDTLHRDGTRETTYEQ